MLRALSDCFSEFKATFIELHGVFETVIESVADQGMAYRHLVAPRNALDEIVQVFEIEVVARIESETALTGGFGGNCSRELLLRWLAFSVFTPLMRDHTAILTRHQECFRYRGKRDFRSILSLRYRLLPYIYSEFMKAALSADLYIRPLAFGYPADARARKIEDELLVGDSLLVAPVLEKGARGRTVYLPAGCTVEADNTIRLGGLRARAGSTEADDTLDMRMENQKDWFLRSCGMSIALEQL